MQALTPHPNFQTSRKHWNTRKERLGQEGSQRVTSCHQLKMDTGDGKALTDVSTAKMGGQIAKRARLDLESQAGTQVDMKSGGTAATSQKALPET